jgi:GPH family glycoside/pentoside/hexuronide:cation symporter
MTRAGRVPLTTRFFYGFGSISEGVKDTAFNTFLLFYYNEVLGLSGTLSGAAIFLALCVDAVTDPLVGSISDNFRSRWGRRHPFMYASALPMALSFWFLFNPPAGADQTTLFAWFSVFAVLVRSSMTLYSIPSNSMVAELTSNYDDRTSLVSWRFMFGWAGGLTMTQIAYRVFFPNVGDHDGLLDAAAYGGFSLVCAVTIFLAILICSAGTHRLIPSLYQPPKASAFSLGIFVSDFRAVFRNHSYRVLLAASLLASVAAGFNTAVGLYMSRYFWEFDPNQIAQIALFLGISLFFGIALARPLTVRFEKKRSAVALTVFGVSFGPLPVFLRLAGLMPANHDPLLLPLIIGHAVLLVTALIIIGILFSSMIADTIDESELITGKRQEGMFSSAIAFTAKATSGIGVLVAGLALDLIDFPTHAEPGEVPQGTVTALGYAVGPGLFFFYAATLFFVSRYSITRARHQQVIAELTRRRGETIAAPSEESATASAG